VVVDLQQVVLVQTQGIVPGLSTLEIHEISPPSPTKSPSNDSNVLVYSRQRSAVSDQLSCCRSTTKRP
jgi:hypothetical protein